MSITFCVVTPCSVVDVWMNILEILNWEMMGSMGDLYDRNFITRCKLIKSWS